MIKNNATSGAMLGTLVSAIAAAVVLRLLYYVSHSTDYSLPAIGDAFILVGPPAGALVVTALLAWTKLTKAVKGSLFTLAAVTVVWTLFVAVAMFGAQF